MQRAAGSGQQRVRLLGGRLLRVVVRVGVRAAAIAVIVGIGWLVLRLLGGH